MEKGFLIENLWTIFEVAREERTDGDNFEGDMGTAVPVFLAALKPGGKKFKCLEGRVDALKAGWDACDQMKAQDEYRAIVGSNPEIPKARKYRDLSLAFTAGDRAAFDAAVDAGMAALYAE